ncbi:hypothetical protein V0288_05565 [Pannus brasiliensis CCIBt3594]|uniref:Uncharacterized protein n=1 Tax=Pannus brasiliensis CCIBt3594 TaxID=1427578 RepID=A0AAW9QTB1_9CHRO
MPSSPYKSRLFKLIVRRSNRFKDRLGRATRSARNTLSLGFQIVLYPIYLLVQSARRMGTGLGQAVQKQLSPVAETPTIEIDRFLDTIAVGEINVTGIATDLENHELQLVTEKERTIPIADTSFQEKLQKQIVATLANYYHDRRQLDRSNRKALSLPPSFEKTKEKVLPPIRWFWELIRWEQTGPVAMTIDLFGESSIVPTRPPISVPPEIPLPPIAITPIIEAIDRRLAELETKSLTTIPEVNGSIVPPESASIETVPETALPDSETSRAWRLYWLIYGAIDHFFSASGSSIGDANETLSLPETGTVTVRETVSVRRVQDGIETRPGEDPFSIARIIQAAIDHFFAPATVPSLSASDDDPWLEVDDLFANTRPYPRESPEITESIPARLPDSVPLPPPPINTKHKISQESSPKSIQKVTKPRAEIVLPKVNPTDIAPVEPPEETRPVPSSPNRIDRIAPDTPSESESEWWETQYTPVGYEKHPLERILAWLDTMILWIEELIIRIWRWLQPRRRRSRNRRGGRD